MHETDGQAQAGAAVLGSDVWVLADVLAALLEHDRQLAVQLNAAQAELLGAADQVRDGVSGDDRARTLLGAAGRYHGFAAAPETGLPAAGAGEAVGETIRRAFLEYQRAAEQRRQVAADVGEATVRIVDALIVAGYSEAQARTADVRGLRDGRFGRAE
ncbi:MAG: hypothetical protein QOK16_2529 [Solirubrobacteraceae bacterium]|nr:hypothetical protein [Solirubrobacteraceae bacterium]